MPRYTLYYCPAPSSALWQFGSAILGYDAVRAETVAHPALPSLSAARLSRWSQVPGRYGFHATLKAPFHPWDTKLCIDPDSEMMASD